MVEETTKSETRPGRGVSLLVFAVAIAALLFVDRLRQPPDPNLIRLTHADVRGILESESQLRGRELSADERRSAVESAITEEVLVREARRRGAHRGDPRIRDTVLAASWRRKGAAPSRRF